MAFPRARLSKITRALALLVLLSYGAVMLIGMVARTHTIRYPWRERTGASDSRASWRQNPQATAGNSSLVVKELARLEELLVKTMNQTKPNKLEVKTPTTQVCAKTVGSLVKYSRWFRDRYRPDIKLFLDKDDISNYQNLTSKGLPFGFKGQKLKVIEDVLQHAKFANPAVHGTAGKQGCIRCAVVGCGGILNGSGAGKEIDGHDYIFRLNRALSSGRFANDVGRRTTFYTFFPESQHVYDVEDESFLSFYAMFKAYDVEYALNMLNQDAPPKYVIRGKIYKMRTPGVSPQKLKFVHPDFFYYVFNKYLDSKAARPTTGALVVVLALHICDEVTIYGFGYDTRFSMHYYDTKFVKHTKASTGAHDVDNERKLWSKLHEEGVLRHFKRDL